MRQTMHAHAVLAMRTGVCVLTQHAHTTVDLALSMAINTDSTRVRAAVYPCACVYVPACNTAILHGVSYD